MTPPGTGRPRRYRDLWLTLSSLVLRLTAGKETTSESRAMFLWWKGPENKEEHEICSSTL